MNLKVYSPQDFPAYLPKLNQLYDDLFYGGKGFRAKLVQAVGGAIHMPEKTQQLLSQTIEFIHNASLLHDDLIDQSELRRGKTAAWKKYTPEYAVLAGDYLLARVMVNLSRYGNIHLVSYTAEMISDLLEGEWLQDSVVGDFFVTLEQLDRIHQLKTASLFKWCLRAPFIAVERENLNLHGLLTELGTILGQLFQRSDDLLDFNIRNHEGKALLGDLKSGYLNSFGAYAIQEIKADRKALNRVIQCKNLEEFVESLGGVANFDKKREEFDQLNQKLIDLYQHHLERVPTYLNIEEQKLVGDLSKLPEILYWRQR